MHPSGVQSFVDTRQLNCVPAGHQIFVVMPDPALPISPIERNVKRTLIHRAEAKVNIGTTLARMSIASIDLFHQLSTVGQIDSDSRSECRVSANTLHCVTSADRRSPG